MGKFSRAITKALILLCRAYRYAISPLLGNCCRFNPSCSQYAEEVMGKYGWVKGGWLVIKRLGRCHPWYTGRGD